MKPTLQLGCSQPPIGHQNFNYLGQVIKPNQKFITCSTKKERKKKNREKRIARVSEHCEKRIALLSASVSDTFLQPSFLFFRCVALYFQPKVLFSAQNDFASAQNVFASAQNFFCFSPKLFSVQPLFSSSFFCFILFWFSPLFSLSAPPFFLFFSSVYPRPNILSSCFTSLLFE